MVKRFGAGMVDYPSDAGGMALITVWIWQNRKYEEDLVTVPNPGFDQYFNPKAFVLSPTVPDFRGAPVQTYGNAGRTILRGPGSRNLDLSRFKEFRATGKATPFNLSNTPTFELPGARTR